MNFIPPKCHALYGKHSPDDHADATNYWRLASEYAQISERLYNMPLHNHGRWTLNRALHLCACAGLTPTNGRGWSCDFVQRFCVTLQCLCRCARSLLLLGLYAACSATPLDDYVNAPDPTYEYRDLGDPWRGDDYTTWLSREQHSFSTVDRCHAF